MITVPPHGIPVSFYSTSCPPFTCGRPRLSHFKKVHTATVLAAFRIDTGQAFDLIRDRFCIAHRVQIIHRIDDRNRFPVPDDRKTGVRGRLGRSGIRGSGFRAGGLLRPCRSRRIARAGRERQRHGKHQQPEHCIFDFVHIHPYPLTAPGTMRPGPV